jgi:hypothetical protein
VNAALVGVLIGGTIALLGQVTVELVRARIADRRDSRFLKGIARVARSDCFTAMELIDQTLDSGTWWDERAGDVWTIDAADRKLLASHLTRDEWRWLSSGTRRFNRCRVRRSLAVVEQRHEIDADDRDELLRALVRLNSGRDELGRLADREPNPRADALISKHVPADHRELN